MLGCIIIVVAVFSAPAFAYEDSGEIPPGWAVWSSWFWPFVDDLNPNLYDVNEAMDRYDRYDVGAQSKNWEYQNHGPIGAESWYGHCHAWSGAACWEIQPTTALILNGIQFRVRDRKGLMTEIYDNCANGYNYEIYVPQPSPGLFWRWLRREIGGVNPMHGHAMAIIGELYYGPEIWNYPIYKYSITYSGNPISGTITIYAASDGDPAYADSKTLYETTFTYQFSGVDLDNFSEPSDSGTWIGSDSFSRPDCIWRPFYPPYWTTYATNNQLDETHVANILNPVAVKNHVGAVLNLLLVN